MPPTPERSSSADDAGTILPARQARSRPDEDVPQGAIRLVLREPKPNARIEDHNSRQLLPEFHKPPAESPKTRSLLLILAAGGIILAVFAGWVTQEPTSPAAVAPAISIPAVSVLTVHLGVITKTVSFSGTIEAHWKQPVTAAGDGGTLVEVRAVRGQRVKKGEVLAVVNAEPVQAQLSELQAKLDEASAESKLAARQRDRLQAAGDVVPAIEREAASSRAETAAANWRAVAARLAQVLSLKKATKITAPADGLVLSRAAEVGQQVGPGRSTAPLFEIAADSPTPEQNPMQMAGNVTEEQLGKIRVGQRARVDLATGESLIATVDNIPPLLDPSTRLGEVRMSLPGYVTVRPGTSAKAQVEVGKMQAARIPGSAVQDDSDSEAGSFVFVLDGHGLVQKRTVQIGGVEGADLLISVGLADGDAVVVLAGRVHENERVRGVPTRTQETTHIK